MYITKYYSLQYIFFSYAQNWQGALGELRNFRDKYPTRRNLEGDVLENDNGHNSLDCTTAGSVSHVKCPILIW